MNARDPARKPAAGELRYDLLDLARRAGEESAYDEGVKVRVTQEDIRKLLAKRRRGRK